MELGNAHCPEITVIKMNIALDIGNFFLEFLSVTINLTLSDFFSVIFS